MKEYGRFRGLELRKVRRGTSGVPVPAGMPADPAIPQVRIENGERPLTTGRAPRVRMFSRLGSAA